MAFDWVSLSCVQQRSRIPSRAILSHNPVLWGFLGDFIYSASGGTGWGYTTATVDKDSTAQDFLDHYEQLYVTPGFKELFSGVRDFFFMPDDHDYGGGDNWDWTIAQANSGTSIGAVTQADVDTHGIRAQQAAIDVLKNASGSVFPYAISGSLGSYTIDSPIVLHDKPSEAAAAASNFEQLYHKIGYDINGNRDDSTPYIELFFTDCCGARSPLAEADSASKYMMGANQEAQFVADVLASTASFKVWVSVKKMHTAQYGEDNQDVWGGKTPTVPGYETQRDRINLALKDVPGFFVCSGDRHRGHSIELLEADVGYDLFDAVGCPTYVEQNAMRLDGSIRSVLNENIYNHFAVSNGRIDIYQRDIVTGKALAHCYLTPSDRLPRYP